MLIKMKWCIAALWLVMGCGQGERGGGPSKQPDQGDVVNSATHDYNFDQPQKPVSPVVPPSAIDNPGVPDSPTFDLPEISWAHLKSTATPNPSSQVIARIHTKSGYPPLHIPPGDSYLWRDKFDPADSKDRSWKLWIVPADLNNTDMRTWKRWKGEIEFSDVHVNPKEPHLVAAKKPSTAGPHPQADMIAIGACIDDPICSANHCGYGDIE